MSAMAPNYSDQEPNPVQRAPVLITVYDRVSHFKRSLMSLSQCDIAGETDIYIASDASPSDKKNHNIAIVRSIAKSIVGFKSVTVFERECNYGVLNNYFDAVDKIFEIHEQLIFLQDDIVVGRGFLRYMNDGLNKYVECKKVISICSYLPPIAEGLSKTPIFLKRRSPYGVGMWRYKEEYLNSITGPHIAEKTLSSFESFKKVSKTSPHVIRALPFIAKGDFRAGDYEMAAAMQLYDLLAIYPNQTIVTNIGLDGSGVHSGKDTLTQDHPYSHSFIDISGAGPVMESSAVASKITKYWSFSGAQFINHIVYFGWNFVPGFYGILKQLKICSNIYKNIKKLILNN